MHFVQLEYHAIGSGQYSCLESIARLRNFYSFVVV